NDKVANGEALLKQEITDRENGDSVTLQAGKDFVTSQIKDYDTGMQSPNFPSQRWHHGVS
uniref:hypothetical protein n=1 Tax=uncultured Weissella sp. TaxID=253243 RepID=UPI00259823A1